MRGAVILTLAALGLVSAGAAAAQGRPPESVLSEVRDMDAMCRDVGGQPGDKEGLLRAADLNGDGLSDWVLDQGLYVCNGAASLFGGSGGSSVMVWAGLPGGGASQPFGQAAFGAKIENGRVWLAVGGGFCGQNTAGLSRAEMTYCERPLAWDARTRKFDFAPVSQIRPAG